MSLAGLLESDATNHPKSIGGSLGRATPPWGRHRGRPIQNFSHGRLADAKDIEWVTGIFGTYEILPTFCKKV